MMKLPRKRKKAYKKLLEKGGDSYSYLNSKEDWEWLYFRRRVEVRNMEVILSYPHYNILQQRYDFDPKFRIDAASAQLLEWYQEHYPNDKLAQHYCRQNRHKWDKFNRK